MGLPSAHVFLGVDQSYSGFALTALAESGEYHSWLYELQGSGISRLRDGAGVIKKTIIDLAEHPHMLCGVAMEGYAFSSQRAHQAGELGAAVKLAVTDYTNVPFVSIPPTALKKYVTGKGNVAKNLMLLGVYKTWDIEFNDDNLADSYALARMASGWSSNATHRDALTKTEVLVA